MQNKFNYKTVAHTSFEINFFSSRISKSFFFFLGIWYFGPTKITIIILFLEPRGLLMRENLSFSFFFFSFIRLKNFYDRMFSYCEASLRFSKQESKTEFFCFMISLSQMKVFGYLYYLFVLTLPTICCLHFPQTAGSDWKGKEFEIELCILLKFRSFVRFYCRVKSCSMNRMSQVAN